MLDKDVVVAGGGAGGVEEVGAAAWVGVAADVVGGTLGIAKDGNWTIECRSV